MESPKWHKEMESKEAKEAKRLIRDASVKPPEDFSFWRVFDPRLNNTAVFIMRVHFAIMLFAVVVVMARLLAPPII